MASSVLKTSSNRASVGFSLAELLLALLILGQIATFTIPKVLSAQESSQRKAVFKETISTYSQIIYEGYITREMAAGNCDTCSATEYGFHKYIGTRINAIKECNQAVPDGCYVGTCAEPTGPGQILATGASTCGVTNKITGGNKHDNFYIDWNGPNKGTGTEGDDQIRLRGCVDTGCPNGQRPGTVIAFPDATNEAFYQEIFK